MACFCYGDEENVSFTGYLRRPLIKGGFPEYTFSMHHIFYKNTINVKNLPRKRSCFMNLKPLSKLRNSLMYNNKGWVMRGAINFIQRIKNRYFVNIYHKNFQNVIILRGYKMRSNSEKGLLVAIDGAKGVGKSALVKTIADHLENNGKCVYYTSEPTDSELGDFIRKKADTYSTTAYTCMMAADRYEHLEKDIIPKLQEGYIVIEERYILSSLVKQCMAGGGEQFVLNINKDIVKPDLQIVLSAEEMQKQTKLYEIEEKDTVTQNISGKEKRCLDYCALIMEQLNVDVLYMSNRNSAEKNAEEICKRISEL